MRWGSELGLNADASCFQTERAPVIEPRARLLASSDDHRPALLRFGDEGVTGGVREALSPPVAISASGARGMTASVVRPRGFRVPEATGVTPPAPRRLVLATAAHCFLLAMQEHVDAAVAHASPGQVWRFSDDDARSYSRRARVSATIALTFCLPTEFGHCLGGDDPITRAGDVGSSALPRTQLSCRARTDDCIARMMRKPNRAKLTSDAALLLL
jgi:hypothetical protein